MSTSPSNYASLLTAHLETAPKIRPSAAVVPWRLGPTGALEVYWVKRSPELRFMGGWHAFPGGGQSRSDAALPIAGAAEGLSHDSVTPPAPSYPDSLSPDGIPGLVACALRELFEETGLLLADVDSAAAREARLALLEDRETFAQVLDRLGVRLDASRLVFAGRWLTPPMAPMGFDNRFFLLRWQEETEPEILPGELVDGAWVEPRRALELWKASEVVLAPPIVHILRVLHELGPRAGLERLRDTRETFLGPFRRVEFRPGVVMLPLLTPTLPPATHTNAFLLGHGECVLVDPATPFPEEQDRLLDALDSARRQGAEIRAIWLTHHHPDHIAAVERAREHLGVPVLAHPASRDALAAAGISLDDTLRDGQKVVLGGDPEMTLEVVFTPGHAAGHLAFFETTSRALIAGDLLSALSTIVIAPPDGDMDEYLRSLQSTAERQPSMLLPAHGPPILDASARLLAVRDHRLRREAKIVKAWKSGKTTPQAMVAEIYDDVPEALHPVACWQIAAHLERLRKIGEIS